MYSVSCSHLVLLDLAIPPIDVEQHRLLLRHGCLHKKERDGVSALLVVSQRLASQKKKPYTRMHPGYCLPEPHTAAHNIHAHPTSCCSLRRVGLAMLVLVDKSKSNTPPVPRYANHLGHLHATQYHLLPRHRPYGMACSEEAKHARVEVRAQRVQTNPACRCPKLPAAGAPPPHPQVTQHHANKLPKPATPRSLFTRHPILPSK